MSADGQQFTRTTHSLRRLRATSEAPRWLLSAAAVAGLAASARYAIAPPHPPVPAPSISPAQLPDRAAEGFATTFARSYLSWDSAEPAGSARALAGYSSPAAEFGEPPQPAGAPSQAVLWAEVVQARVITAGVHAYTVAVQTDSSGLVYLGVEVRREAGGGLSLAALPAFVGPPAVAPPTPGPHGRQVADPSLATVAGRALRNYMARAGAELDADLFSRARVSLPQQALALQAVRSLTWSPYGGSVVAEVHAQDSRGVGYDLSYEIEVVRDQGRWEVSAVQMDPYA